MATVRPLAHLVRLSSVCALAFFALGCADQGEGERCDLRNGNADCESGLECTPADELIRVEGKGAALCCPPEGEAPSTEGCQRSGMVIPTGDGGLATGGTGGSGGSGGSGGTGGSGATGGSGGSVDGG